MTAFIDTNIFVYATGTEGRSEIARDLIRRPGRISVQTLNEFASVARRKLKLDWSEMHALLDEMARRHGPVVPLTETLHRRGRQLAREYGFAIYDAMIVAAALAAGCDTLYSEDMHDRLVVDGALTIRNPFV